MFNFEQRYLPQDLAKSRTGDVPKEENLEDSINVQGVASTKVRGENSEVKEAMENFKGCEWTERHFHGGADESIEVMNVKVNFEGISGDYS